MVKKSVSRVVKVFTLLLSVLLLATITVGAASACNYNCANCDKQCFDDSSCYKQCVVCFTASCDDNKCCEDDNECEVNNCEDDNECEVNNCEVNNCEVNHCEVNHCESKPLGRKQL